MYRQFKQIYNVVNGGFIWNNSWCYSKLPSVGNPVNEYVNKMVNGLNNMQLIEQEKKEYKQVCIVLIFI